MKRLFLASILAPCLLSLACTRATVRELSEVRGVHDELTKKFGEEISVHLGNGRFFTIAFINSRLNEKTSQERAKRAEETGQIVHAHYADSTVITGIYVVFLRRETHFLVFHKTDTVDEYGFERRGQQLRRATLYWPAPLPDREITASSSSEGTHISANIFQLDGEPGGYGMTVMPHFTLSGDAKRMRVPPPEKVTFNFASYSKKPRFAEPVTVLFIADGKPVAEETAAFSGKDAQFCSVYLSYSAFHKLIDGKEVSIKLGAREYPLTPKQIETLQKMDAYVLQ